MISMGNKLLMIHDLAALRNLAMFDASYLHLDGAGLLRDRLPERSF